jgi:hypothetical protein
MSRNERLNRKTLSGALLMLSLVLLTTGAASGSGVTQVDDAGCTGTPIISSFSASPSNINPGQTSLLSWGMVYNAERVVLIAPGQKTGVGTPGEMTVYPDQTTTYTLQADCGSTSVKSQVTVSITVPDCSGTPSISSFTAAPMLIKPGETSTLLWDLVANAEAAVLATPEGKEGVGTPGQYVVQPSQTTTYVLGAFCGDQIVKRYATVAVEGPLDCSGTPIIPYFTASPSLIPKGESSTLEYGKVSNASGAYLRGPEGIAGVGTPGQTVVQPAGTATYALYANCGSTITKKEATIYVE